MTALFAPTKPHQDNLLGVCAALGEDFGFNPLWLRLALGAGLLWNFEAVIAGYLIVGGIVAFSRWVAPNPKPRAIEAHAPQPASTQDIATIEPFAQAA